MRHPWLARAPKLVVIGALAAAAFGLAVMALWNWLVPELLGLPRVGFWQALGLLLLARILFGGLRGTHSPHAHWRHRLIERWEQMSPEERERLRAGMRSWCGHSGPKGGEAQA